MDAPNDSQEGQYDWTYGPGGWQDDWLDAPNEGQSAPVMQAPGYWANETLSSPFTGNVAGVG